MRLSLALLVLSLGWTQAAAQTPTATGTGAIPTAVEAALRTIYADSGGEIRYVAGSMNLNSGGLAEIVVYVVGQTGCSSGGCDTLVFTPEADGFRHVATIRSTLLPIRVSTQRSNGWRNLIVGVSRDGVRAPDAELRYDGTSYPSNAIEGQAHRDAKTITQVVIPQYGSP